MTLDRADLFGPTAVVVGGGSSAAGRPKLPIRLMASLIYLKNCFNLSDEELCARCDTAVAIKAVKPAELERVIVDTTVQEKAIAHLVDSRLLEIARHKVIGAAKRAGIQLKQTYANEGKELRRRAGGYAEPGHKLSSGQFVPGEGLGLWPNAVCKAMPSSSVG